MATKIMDIIKKECLKNDKIANYKLDTKDYNPTFITSSQKKLYMTYDYINNGYSGDEICSKYNIIELNDLIYFLRLVKCYGYEIFLNPVNDKGYSRSSKLRMVKEVVEKGKSIDDVSIANRILNKSSLRLWVKKYKENGEDAIKDKSLNRYDKVIKAIEKGSTFAEVSRKYKITETYILYIWALYKEHGMEVFNEIQARKVYTQKEKEEILKYYYENGENTTKTASHFKMRNISTLNSWIPKDPEVTKKEKKKKHLRKYYKKDLDIANDILNGSMSNDEIAKKYKVKLYRVKYTKEFLEIYGIEEFDIEKRLRHIISEEKKKEIVYKSLILGQKNKKLALENKIINFDIIVHWKKQYREAVLKEHKKGSKSGK